MSAPNLESQRGIVATRDELFAVGRARRPFSMGSSRRVATSAAGAHASRAHGPGMAFSEVRGYTAGDDVRTIDWRVTARTGQLHSKLFEAERERPVFLAVDLSATMQFATRGAFKSVVAARAASLLAWDAYEAGERVGATVWSAAACVELPAGRTRRHLMRLLDALAAGTLANGGSGARNLEDRLGWLRVRARTGSRVVVLSDFYTLDAAASSALRALGQRCELQLVWIYDALEAAAPPAGRYPVSNGSRTELLVARTNERWREAYGRDFRAREERLERLARETRATLTRLATDSATEDVRRGQRCAVRGGGS